MCVCVCVCVREREREINDVIQEEEFNANESHCYNISVLMEQHQDQEG